MIPNYNRYNYIPMQRKGVRGPQIEDERNLLPFLVGAAIGLPIGLIASNKQGYMPYQSYPGPAYYPQPYPIAPTVPYQPYPYQYY